MPEELVAVGIEAEEVDLSEYDCPQDKATQGSVVMLSPEDANALAASGSEAVILDAEPGASWPPVEEETDEEPDGDEESDPLIWPTHFGSDSTPPEELAGGVSGVEPRDALGVERSKGATGSPVEAPLEAIGTDETPDEKEGPDGFDDA